MTTATSSTHEQAGRVVVGRTLVPLSALTALALLSGWLIDAPAVSEAWFLAFIILTGFAAASLGLLMIGHLLGDVWLAPIRDELEPASWTLPLLALLAFPLSSSIAELYPWAGGDASLPLARQSYLSPHFFLLRGALCLILWSVLAVVIARSGAHRGASAIGLALLAATFSLAAVDWVMSREPHFWSSLFGFAFAVSQLLAALAAAILVTIWRQGHPERLEMQSLERALLTLALLSGWVWFSQYLVVWMANLPGEAAWYIARRGTWQWLNSGVALPALLLAILLLMPSRARRWRVLAACVSILLHHLAYMVWVIRPASSVDVSWVDVLVVGGLAGLWALWFATGLRHHAEVSAALSRSRRADGQR